MSEPDKFLSRWSRRKAAATEKDVAQAAMPDAEAKADASAQQVEQKEAGAGVPAAPTIKPPPEFDPSTLPAIESIVAGTDVTAFLKVGVPAELTRAALRRAWATDPNIRDFIGLSENSWDFTAPDGVPGFGPLSAEDASRLMAQFTSTAKDVAGKAKEAVERISALDQPAEPAQAKRSPGESMQRLDNRESAAKKIASPEQDQPEQKPGAIDDASNSLQRGKENIATQQNKIESNDSAPARRTHGSALPD